jgi:hypothetical protein
LGEDVALAFAEGSFSVLPGDRLIILLGQHTESGGAADVTPELCGLVPYSDSNLAFIGAGVAPKMNAFHRSSNMTRSIVRVSFPTRRMCLGRQAHTLHSQPLTAVSRAGQTTSLLALSARGRVANLGGGASNQLQ